MANPWSNVMTPSNDANPLHPSHVIAFADRQHQKAKGRDRGAQTSTKKAYPLKDRDFVTYNYTEGRGEEEDNTLSNILVRAMQRKTRRREIDDAMKMKRLQETKLKAEEEKRRCQEAKFRQEARLREMREMHQLRLLKEEQWRAREARQARNNKLAEDFRKTRLLRHYFRACRRLVQISRANRIKARDHYRQKVMHKAFSSLRIHSCKEIEWRDQIATQFYEAFLLQKFFARWKEEKARREQEVERATHHHQKRVMRRVLWGWRWAAIDLVLQRRSDSLRASQHYLGKLLAHGLTAWRRYVRERKARRQRDVVGTRLRGLVKDIMPDFSPSSASSDDDDNDNDDAAKRCADWMLSLVT